MPPNRKTIYNVVRTQRIEIPYEYFGWNNATVVASCRTVERADELKGKYQQEMKDSGFEEFKFEVQASVYYDE